jgi:hypothetical protein
VGSSVPMPGFWSVPLTVPRADEPGTSASPGTGTTPAATIGPEGSAAPTFRPADPDAPVRFAVGLLDVDESQIAPGDAAAITRLGTAAGPGASPQPGNGAGTGEPVERPNARDEIWIPIVLVALLVLTLEWLVYERDTLARLRRTVAGRLRSRPAAGKGA